MVVGRNTIWENCLFQRLLKKKNFIATVTCLEVFDFLVTILQRPCSTYKTSCDRSTLNVSKIYIIYTHVRGRVDQK